MQRQVKKNGHQLICLNDNIITFNKTETFICTYNDGIYRYSSNNQLESGDDPLLAAEYAVFSGNLLKFILGKYQPGYYLAKSSRKEIDKYYRICDQLENYENWSDVVRLNETGNLVFKWPTEAEKDILDVNIRNLTAIVLASQFLGEIDWNEDNFGFVKFENEYIAVRIDPGCSFNSALIEANYTDLPERLENLLVSYISKEVLACHKDAARYLCDLIDHEKGTVKIPAAQQLFSRKEEIVQTLTTIANITQKDLHKIAKQSFSEEHWNQAQELINLLLNRQEMYQAALQHILNGKNDNLSSSPVSLPKTEVVTPSLSLARLKQLEQMSIQLRNIPVRQPLSALTYNSQLFFPQPKRKFYEEDSKKVNNKEPENKKQHT